MAPGGTVCSAPRTSPPAVAILAQNDVALPPHQLRRQPDRRHARLRPATRKGQLDHALPARLADRGQARALQMLAQEHHEGGRLVDHLARAARGEMHIRKLRMRRDDEPAFRPLAVEQERDGLRRRLDDILDARAQRRLRQLVGDGGQGQGVGLHGRIPLKERTHRIQSQFQRRCGDTV